MQGHYWTGALSVNNVRDSIERFIETGARVTVTELDLPLGTYQGFAQRTDNALERQAMLYAQLFSIFIEYSEYIDRVTVWGKADTQSWRWEGYPVLFDGDFQPKPSFWSILDVATGAFEEDHPVLEDPSPDETLPEETPPISIPEATPDPIPLPEPEIEQPASSGFPQWGILLICIGVSVVAVLIYIIIKKSK